MTNIFLRRKLSGATGTIDLNVDLQIERGELITLYGPSGAGKTSILRMIAGVFSPDEGGITVNGVTWLDTEKKICLTPQKRGVGIVYQDYALFPNMSVAENIRYGLSKDQSDNFVDELIGLMELDGLRDKKPHLLSGGQKQRVALARAIVRKPTLLLLDEPLAALDTELRMRMQQYILQAQRRYGFTTILVSHDILEVYRLSNKVCVLKEGKIVRTGPPDSVIPLQTIRDMIQGLGGEKRI